MFKGPAVFKPFPSRPEKAAAYFLAYVSIKYIGKWNLLRLPDSGITFLSLYLITNIAKRSA
jgi:hypothetical protein